MTAFQPLTAEEIRTIAEAYYRQREIKAVAADRPTMMLVGGQTGAGKSVASALVRAELRNAGGFIHVDADRLRERIDLRGAKPTSEQTQVTAGALASTVRALAIEGRRNLLEEGTFRNPSGVTALVQRIQAVGYRVELVAVATPLEESRLGIYQRFEAQHAQHALNPRFITDQYHDETASGFAATVATVSSQFDRVRVIGRDGQAFYDSHEASRSETAIDALKRGRSINDDRLGQVIASWEIVRALAEGRNADAGHLQAIDRQLDQAVRFLDRRREFEAAMDAQGVPKDSRPLLSELFVAEFQQRHQPGRMIAAHAGVDVAEDRPTAARTINDRAAPER